MTTVLVIGAVSAAGAVVRNVTSEASLTSANSAAQPGDTIMVAAGTYNVRPVPARDGTAAGVIAYVGNPGNPSAVILNNSPSDGGATARSFVSWDGFYCKEDWGFFGSQSPAGVLDSLRIARCILEEGGGMRKAYRSGYYNCVIGVYNKPDRSMYITGAGQNGYIKRCLMRLQIPNINQGNDILKFDWNVSNPTGEFIRSFTCDSNVIEVKITGTACADTTNYETLTRGIKIRGVRQSFFRWNRITISDSTTGSCVGATKVGFWMRDYADSNTFLADTIIADGGNLSSLRFDITNDGNGGAGFPRNNTYRSCIFMNLTRCYATRRLEGLYWRGGMNDATIDSCSFVNGVNAGSMDIATMAGTNRLVHNDFVALGGRPAVNFVCNTCTGANTTFRNNILYSQPSPPANLAPLLVNNTGAMSFDSDYNLYTNLARPNQAVAYNGVAQEAGPLGLPCAVNGRDCHSISFSPGFVDSLGPSYNPQLLPYAKPIGAAESQRTIGVKQYPPGYTLAVNTVGAGTVTTLPDLGSYDFGALVVITATPGNGYHFVGWSGGASGSTNPLTVLMDGNKSITATFAINTYSLGVTPAGPGHVTKVPDLATYDHGTQVQITATPGIGYHFVSWGGDTSGTVNPLTLVMTRNRAITSSFAINTYALSAVANGNGTVTRAPNQATYDYGTSVQLTASPALGYHFVSWGGDTSDTANPLTVVMTRNRTITGSFAINTYTLSAAASGNGSVSRSPDQAAYDHGSSVQLTATPAAGYHFVGWSGDTSGTVNPFTVVLHQDRSYTATFAINTYTLSAAAMGSGNVTRAPDLAAFDHGAQVQLTATPGSGYHFAGWDGDTSGTANPLTVVMTRDRTITGSFAINTYSIATSVVGSGSVTRSPDQAAYDHGSSVQLVAVPGNGYHFVGWSGDTTGTSDPFDVVLHANKSYTANFAINTYSIAASVVGSGSVTRSPDQATYDHGSSVQLAAVPGNGYHFVSWSGDTTGTSNPFSVVLHTNRSYTATFAINTYSLGALAVGPGTVTKSPDLTSYEHGSSVQLTAAPDFGYHFVAWSGDTTGATNPFDVILHANRSYTATFAMNTYSMATSVVGSGSVTRSPDQAAYDHGSSVQLVAVPANGYHFVSWSGDTTGTSNPFDVILHANRSYTATFAINTYSLGALAVGPGTVTKSPDLASYEHGSSVQLTAGPDFGYHFVSWSGDTTGTLNPFDVILHANRSYTATFAINAYSVATSVVGSGSVTRSPDLATYDHGSSVQLIAVPGIGYHFISWGGDTTGTSNPFDVILHANRSYTATFEINTYSIATSVVGSGSVTRSPNQAAYDHGSSVQVAGVPSNGYHFVSWSGDTTGTTNPFDVTLHADKAYTATFAINSYTLEAVAVGPGTVAKSPDQPSYEHGSSVELTATPAAHYHFAGWSGDATGTVNPLIVLTDNDQTITATFSIDTYALTTAVVGSGTVTVTPDHALYEHGSEIEIAATPAAGYTFTEWSGDTSGTDNPFTVTLLASRSYTATFTINTYSLTVTPAGSGTVALLPDQVIYDHGTIVQVTANPEPGFAFESWSGDTTATANPLTFVMTRDRNLTATFTITYTLTVTIIGQGMVAKNPDHESYAGGSVVNLTAIADKGYGFAGWGGDTTGEATPMTLTMDRNREITATFVAPAAPEVPSATGLGLAVIAAGLALLGSMVLGRKPPEPRQPGRI